MFRVKVYRIDPSHTPPTPTHTPEQIRDEASCTIFPAKELAMKCAERFNQSQLDSPTGLWAVVSDTKLSAKNSG